MAGGTRARWPDRELSAALAATSVPAVSRAVAILRLLGESPAPLGVHAVARELGLAPSTCFNLLKALAVERLVVFHPTTKQYALAAGVLTLASHWLRANKFGDRAQPLLDRIAEALDVTVVALNYIDLDTSVVVAISKSPSLQLGLHVGTRFPGLSSAAGRCVAAFAREPRASLAAHFAELRWDEAPSFEQWIAEVETARARGSGLDEGQHTAGVTAVAAPVWEGGDDLRHLVVAYGLSGPMRRKGVGAVQHAITSAAEQLSERG
jgi:DNA-binding IclR family transcriptional regulator